MNPPSSPRWLAAALTALALAAPPAAMATNYCVGDAACVSGGGIDKGTGAAGLTAALTAAAAHANAGGPDRVIVGAGTYSRTAGNAAAFRADTGDALTLQGAGATATVLSRETFNNGAVLAAGPATTVADLGIVIPGGTGMLGLGLGGSAENVAVTVAPGGATSASGVALQAGATFGHGTLTVPGGTGAAMTAGGTLTDSTVSGLYGVQASGVATVRRARFVHATTGISAYGATLTVEDTLFDLGGVASTALYAEANVNGNAVTTLCHLTIVHGVSNAVGVELQSYDGMSSTGTLRDSAINGVGRPFELGAGDPGSVTSLATSFSSFPDDELLRWGTNGAAVPAPPANTNRLSGTPGFVDGAAGDWRLRFDSALVDAGTPGVLGAAESATDAAGLPRRVAGRRDAGAFEYQRRAPVVTAAADATTAAIGAVVAFTGSGADPDPGEVVAGYQWTFDDGASAG
ncbi:MAG: hypothetical protein QOK49_2019, partial [Baekduia sp.]|nr:hypothetical protein [Baekduia sp.]